MMSHALPLRELHCQDLLNEADMMRRVEQGRPFPHAAMTRLLCRLGETLRQVAAAARPRGFAQRLANPA